MYEKFIRGKKHSFNLSQTEVVELDCVKGISIQELIERLCNPDLRVVQAEEIFKEIIRNSYGRKSYDGQRFIKEQSEIDAFLVSEECEELIDIFLTDANEASDFINSVISEQ